MRVVRLGCTPGSPARTRRNLSLSSRCLGPHLPPKQDVLLGWAFFSVFSNSDSPQLGRSLSYSVCRVAPSSGARVPE